MKNTEFINSQKAFDDFLSHKLKENVLAIDTEFQRINTYFPKPGLFQLNCSGEIVLVDPFEIDDWSQFKSVLQDQAVTKVFHACDEDLELIFHYLGVKCASVFDTQVAAAFCGYDFSMGYQRIIKAVFDIELEKGSSRSDWLQRPLAEKQLMYAANDVRYLLDLHDILSSQLDQKGMRYCHDQEVDQVILGLDNVDYSDAYLRIKQAWTLNARQLPKLQALAEWREEQMRERDLPRKWVATNDALLELAKSKKVTPKNLFELKGLSSAVVKEQGQVLCEIVNDTRTVYEQDQLIEKPLKPGKFTQSLKKALTQIALKNGIALQMLSKKSYNEELARAESKGHSLGLEEIQCWRRPYYQEALESLQNG